MIVEIVDFSTIKESNAKNLGFYKDANMNQVMETTAYNNISASTLIRTGRGALLGIFVASASSTPTIKLWDNTSAATTILVNTFVPSAATFYPIPATFGTGLYVTISGTVDCTVLWNPLT